MSMPQCEGLSWDDGAAWRVSDLESWGSSFRVRACRI
jgi:hypothetical protein